MIKAKDPQLQQINIAIPDFFASTPLEGTQLVELPFQHSAEEEATSSHPVLEETAKVVEVLDSDEDFEVFDQLQAPKPSGADFSHLPPTQVSGIQEAPSVPDTMVLQHKSKTSLLKLLESHAGGLVPNVAIQTHPPTPLPAHTSQPKLVDKKSKRDKKGKDVAEEGEVISSKDPEPQRGVKVAKTTQTRSSSEGAIVDRGHDHHPKVQS